MDPVEHLRAVGGWDDTCWLIQPLELCVFAVCGRSNSSQIPLVTRRSNSWVQVTADAPCKRLTIPQIPFNRSRSRVVWSSDPERIRWTRRSAVVSTDVPFSVNKFGRLLGLPADTDSVTVTKRMRTSKQLSKISWQSFWENRMIDGKWRYD